MRRDASKPADVYAPSPTVKLTLVEVPKTPGIMAFDLCWNKFVNELDDCFDENWQRHEAYLESTGVQLLPKDRVQMDDLRKA